MNKEKLLKIANDIMIEDKIEFDFIQDVFFSGFLPAYRNDKESTNDTYYTQDGVIVEYSYDRRFFSEKEIEKKNKLSFLNKKVINRYRYCISSTRLIMYLLEKI